MLIYLALLFPIVTAVLLLAFYRKYLVWWEISIPFVASLVVVIITKWASETSQVRDTEYWGSLVTQAEYYEDWNERVSCRHDRYCTRTVTDSQGQTRTESYVCGKEHSYDVDYHPAEWLMLTDCKERFSIEQSYYYKLVEQFGNENFVELNRDYHSDDGDKYISVWNGEESSARPVVTLHTYENRVQASKSVFNYEAVSDSDKAFYTLFDYPNPKGYSCNSILGADYPDAEKKLRYLNGYLGPKKQLRIWVLVFKNQPRNAGLAQEAYWKGGNKNEFVVCIGITDSNRVAWSHVFSWSEVFDLKADAKNFVESQAKLDLSTIAIWLERNLQNRFVRKQFAEFSYLTVEPSGFAIASGFVIVLLSCVGTGIFVVKNGIEK